MAYCYAFLLLSPGWEAQGMPSTILSLESLHIVCVQKLEFIVMLSEKYEPGYQPPALDSVPYSSLSYKSHCRGLNLWWQTAKIGSKVIHVLLLWTVIQF